MVSNSRSAGECILLTPSVMLIQGGCRHLGGSA